MNTQELIENPTPAFILGRAAHCMGDAEPEHPEQNIGFRYNALVIRLIKLKRMNQESEAVLGFMGGAHMKDLPSGGQGITADDLGAAYSRGPVPPRPEIVSKGYLQDFFAPTEHSRTDARLYNLGLDVRKALDAAYPENDPNEGGQAPTDELTNTLAERGERYGVFSGHASIAQGIKQVMRDTDNWGALSSDKKEALEMIAHKIARIRNGDPEYVDSWHDIAGYSKLIEDAIEGGA